jgi:pimeloyl-ACP methyl ester carboxylesterase
LWGRVCVQVVLVDPRGTGTAFRITTSVGEVWGAAEELAEALALFRADSCVRDCELLRERLLGPDRQWVLAGQSWGGFCSLTYLSQRRAGVSGAILTGGLPGLANGADEVYARTAAHVVGRTEALYAARPMAKVHAAVLYEALRRWPIALPQGGVWTARRMLAYGMAFGTRTGEERVATMLSEAFEHVPSHEVTVARVSDEAWLRRFRDGLAANGPFLAAHSDAEPCFANFPIYAILHESIYCDGALHSPSAWSAFRVTNDAERFPRLHAAHNLLPMPADDPAPHFFGEVVFPWTFVDFAPLRPLAAAAELLAARERWPKLYDADALRDVGRTLPLLACIYERDAYVPLDLSLLTAEHLAATQHREPLLEHTAIRDVPEHLARLDAIFRKIDIPPK